MGLGLSSWDFDDVWQAAFETQLCLLPIFTTRNLYEQRSLNYLCTYLNKFFFFT